MSRVFRILGTERIIKTRLASMRNAALWPMTTYCTYRVRLTFWRNKKRQAMRIVATVTTNCRVMQVAPTEYGRREKNMTAVSTGTNKYGRLVHVTLCRQCCTQ